MNSKGQGTFEYIIIVAVIIVVTLAIVMVFDITDIGFEMNESQSKSYWQTTNPIAILDWKITNTGKWTLTLKNKMPAEIKINKIYIDNNAYNLNITLYNKAKQISFETNNNYEPYVQKKFKIAFEYDTEYLKNKKEIGKKPLIATIQKEKIAYRIITLNGDNLTNYQVKLRINADSLTNNNFSNIAFFDSTDNALPFWIENYIPGNYADVWVKIPQIPGEIKMKYIEATQNPNNTFEFFDNFDNLNNWNVSSSDYLISGGYLTLNKGAVALANPLPFQMQDGYALGGKIKYSSFTSGYSGTLTAVSQPYTSGGNSNGTATVLYMRQTGSRTLHYWIGAGNSNSYNCGNADLTSTNENVWYSIEERFYSGGVKLYLNNSLLQDVGCGWAKPLSYITLGYFAGSSTAAIQPTVYDYIFIRKYHEPEPTYTISNIEYE